jgi:hypothetical protein
MPFYVGFLKESKTHAVVFRSIIQPRRGDFSYFVKVMGPFNSWEAAKHGLKSFKGYSENPVKNPISKADIQEAVALGKRVYRLYKSVRKKNPGKSYHDQRFLSFMKELDKYVIGSAPYIATLAKAYEHLQSAQDSERERV